MRKVFGFVRNDSGAIAPMFGMAIGFLVMVMAMMLELGRWAIAQNELQAALDAAVLAGAKHYQDNPGDQAAAIGVAQKAFDANRSKRRFGSDISESINFSVEDGNSLQARGTSDLNTVLAKVVGESTLPLLGRSGATNRATVTNSEFEVAVMLDVTGSMCDDAPDNVSDAPCTKGKKLDGMKTAAVKLVEKMLGTADLRSRVRISIVPFSDGVRLPKGILNLPTVQLAAAGLSPGVQTLAEPYTERVCTGSGRNRQCENVTRYNYYYYHPTDCVGERFGSNAYTDAAPGPNNYVMYAMQRRASILSNSTPQEFACSLGSSSTVLPLTNDKDAIVTKINSLAAKGGTAGQLGTAWAWYTLSPKWKDVFPGSANDPGAYTSKSDKTLRKIAVLMTDGEYNNQFSRGSDSHAQGCANVSTFVTACGYRTGSWAYTSSATGANSATQALALCAAMKAEPANIEVYTVGYAVNDSAWTMLKTCASSDKHAFKADTSDALIMAFDGIAQRVLALYLSQ